MEDARDPVATRLASADPAARAAAALELARALATDRLGLLLERLPAESEPDVVAALLKAIGVLGRPSELALLAQYIDHANPKVRATVIEALWSLNTPVALPLIIPFLSDTDPKVRANSAAVLRSLGPERALRVLQQMMGSPHVWMRCAAATALSLFDAKVAVPRLEQALKDTSPRVAERATLALGHFSRRTLKAVTKGISKEAVRAVLKATSQPNLRLSDGSRYQCFHVQGKFNRKFDLRSYPLDEQELPIELEDSRHLAGELGYKADSVNCGFSRDIDIPGWEVDGGKGIADVLTYPTTFGRPQGTGGNERYARFVYRLKISRPWAPYLIRMLVPLLVIMLSAFVPFYLNPSYADARIGISVTSLLSAVALHLTVSADLPHVGYVRLIDKIYNLAYLVIFATLLASVVAIRARASGAEQRALTIDRWVRRGLFGIATVGMTALVYLR